MLKHAFAGPKLISNKHQFEVFTISCGLEHIVLAAYPNFLQNTKYHVDIFGEVCFIYNFLLKNIVFTHILVCFFATIEY